MSASRKTKVAKTQPPRALRGEEPSENNTLQFDGLFEQKNGSDLWVLIEGVEPPTV